MLLRAGKQRTIQRYLWVETWVGKTIKS